ncbi:DUF4082 domain-containing protein [Paenibacillus sp. MWE-103]|uniref:DUF4082 domain-containing protein n=1 Tax=Paenibacillus artemisiicola TaxID=1172618 RepID=A0ABS3W5X7_9BACL|nr:DUF4082 domain-containing protein [Paenibacillus artemisiicola]MBO7743686.1 DUF4082 domain-containing protein [Paenibacillus artemisiicola]
MQTMQRMKQQYRQIAALVVFAMLTALVTTGGKPIHAAASGQSEEQTIFTVQTPTGSDSDTRYELGTRFAAEVDGLITKVRLYASASEGGTHTVRIWNAEETAVVGGPYEWTFEAGTAGWKVFELPKPVEAAGDTDYIVAVSNGEDKYYSHESGGFSKPIINGNLITYKGSGLFTTKLGQMPSTSFGDANYFRDVVFVPKAAEAETLFGKSQSPEPTTDAIPYELGVKFSSDAAGWITAVNVFGVKGETGDHTVRIWSTDDGKLLAGPYTFAFAGNNDWVAFELPERLSIQAGVTYTAAVSTGSDDAKYYPVVPGGLSKAGSNGSHLAYPANAGVFSTAVGAMPKDSFGGGNYLRDITFQPNASIPQGIQRFNRVKDTIEALGAIQDLHLDLSDYERLTVVQKVQAVELLLAKRPETGFVSRADAQAALDTAIADVRRQSMTKALKYVNWAAVPEAMEDALLSPDLQLALGFFDKLSETQRKAVTREMIRKRPAAGYADQAAVQARFDSLVFGDIKGRPEESMLADWINRGFLVGHPDATIRPDEIMTASEFAALANRALQLGDGEALRLSDFGYPAGKPLTIEDGAVLVARIANLDTGVAVNKLDNYKDAKQVKPDNRKYVNAALAGGYLKPVSGDRLGANQKLTTAKAVSLLYSVVDPDVGQPNFYPVGVWQQSASNAMAYRNIGINMYVGPSSGLTDANYRLYDAAHMKLILGQDATDRKFWPDSMIYAWMQSDEPDNAQSDGSGGYGPPIQPDAVVQNYNRWKAADPTRPVFLNLGQGVAWKDWYGRGTDTGKQELYPEYAKGADIVSFDIYPVNSTDAPVAGKLHLVAEGVSNLKTWTEGRKPVWTVIETSNYNGVEGHTPTPEQVRSEVWMAIIQGASGLEYFTHSFNPTFIEATPLQDETMKAALAKLNRQIRSLAPVINSGSIAQGVSVTAANSAARIDSVAKEHNGDLYVFASGASSEDTKATIHVPYGKTVEVIGENRSLAVKNGAFADSFAGYGVHLYRIVKQ